MKPTEANRGRSLVLTVHPRHAEAILKGSKTVDLRRRRPSITPGAIGYLYVTSPVSAVVGVFLVGPVTTGSVSVVWKKVETTACLSIEEYELYFDGRDQAHAIEILDPVSLPKPVSLDHIRRLLPTFRPPRSFGYLQPSTDKVRQIMAVSKRYMASLRNDRLALQS